MNVLVTGNLPAPILDTIRKEHTLEVNTEDRPMARQQLLDAVADKHGILTMLTDQVDEELLERAPHLTIVANCAVGYDNIDIAAATRKRIAVTNTPGVLTDSTADVAFALMLAVARRVVEGDHRVRQGRFKHFAPFHFLGQDISGKTLGIIGMGRIGQAVAKRAVGFDMPIIYTSRTRLPADREAKISARYTSLEALLQEADFISLHIPLTPQTRHLMGVDQLRLMKPSAILINTARGPIIDETALLLALRQNWIRGAGLDVYENEPLLTPGLTECENAVLLPHVGSATIETRTRMAQLATHNLLTGLRGSTPPNCLNRDIFNGNK
jgi:glyoxylate reductase